LALDGPEALIAGGPLPSVVPADATAASAGIPEWVRPALRNVPLVVVRRERARAGQIAVGVRGRSRSERFAAFVACSAVRARITPEMLVEQRRWRLHTRAVEIAAIRQLEIVSDKWSGLGLSWGPTGSVGFELASGWPTATTESDLDLVIRAGRRLPMNVAQAAAAAVQELAVRVDVQIETPGGSIALLEYVQQDSKLLMRTFDGPCLATDPWAEE
jgi:phosphoribosyl-dephospho-CoA transferase